MGDKQSVLCIAQVGVWGLGSHFQVPWSLPCLFLSWRSSLKAHEEDLSEDVSNQAAAFLGQNFFG